MQAAASPRPTLCSMVGALIHEGNDNDDDEDVVVEEEEEEEDAEKDDDEAKMGRPQNHTTSTLNGWK